MWQLAFRIPAQWANRFSIRVQGGLVRVVFGDALVGAHASFHTHIAMTADYAKALALFALIIFVALIVLAAIGREERGKEF